MRYITFSDTPTNSYPVCILSRTLRASEMASGYVTELGSVGVPAHKVVAYHHPGDKKKADRKQFYNQLFRTLTALGTRYVMVNDAETYRDLVSFSGKVDNMYGYVLPCQMVGWEHLHIVYVPSIGQLFHRPELKARIVMGIEALRAHVTGTYQHPGNSIIHFAEYPETPEAIEAWLDKLIDMQIPLAVDIEAFSLKHHLAGIGTISFAWSQHEGIAFRVDLGNDSATSARIRAALKRFFNRNSQPLRMHKVSYDAYVLIYQLYMKDLLDTVGLYEGMNQVLRNWDCTLLISYLATNSAAGNQLGLKAQGQEFSGNYAVEVEDITLVDPAKLLEYNLVDSLTTHYVYNKNYPKMTADQQLEVYEELFKPSTLDIIQMQLTGMPLDMGKVVEGKVQMEADLQSAVSAIMSSPIITAFQKKRAIAWSVERNKTLKKKRVTPDDFKEEFNIGSSVQLVQLLYEHLMLPVIDLSKNSGGPATGGKTLKKLINHTKDQQVIDLLNAIRDYKAVSKILEAFIPAFLEAPLASDGKHYLFGSFHLGGTVSGRLSSSNVNLQQLPATGSKYAKIIKKMFVAPEGWLFVGIDYESLEDRISALTTKDPMKLKVYTDGYDGHCLRAYYYFKDQMPDIDPSSVESINSIEKLYKELRQASKAPTFALTYQGTYTTLMKNCGFTKEVAQQIEANYHSLYAVSDAWVKSKIEQACIDGFITAAFGLRVRTPLLKQCILGTRSTPREAAAEGRTAGNALGQSYCMLNTRAMQKFMQKVRTSKYKHLIRPCAQIHDAQYYLVKNDVNVVQWLNVELVKDVKWQDMPEIQHDQVKLGGSVEIFYPNWATPCKINNDASNEDIRASCRKHMEKYRNAA